MSFNRNSILILLFSVGEMLTFLAYIFSVYKIGTYASHNDGHWWNFTQKCLIWKLVHSRYSLFLTVGYSWSIFLQNDSFESCISSGSINSASSGISETKNLRFLLSFHNQDQELLEWRMEWSSIWNDIGKNFPIIVSLGCDSSDKSSSPTDENDYI